MDLYSARIHQLSGAQGALLPMLLRLIRLINHSWGVYSSIAAITAHIGPINQPALTGTHLTPGWKEAIMIKCLAQGHKCHGRDSNPHSTANTRT